MEAVTTLPLTAAQHAIWLGQQMASDSAAYNIASLLRFDGRLDAQRLAAALNQAVGESTCLRVRLCETQGQVQQQILAEPRCSLAEHAFADESQARRWMASDLATPVDLEQGPLLQASLVRIADAADCLYVKSHHIALDGVGLGLFLKRWAQLYAERCGQNIVAAPLGAFDKVLEAEQAYQASPRYAQDRSFWQGQVDGSLTVASLNPQVKLPTRQALLYRGQLSEAAFQRLRQCASQLHSHWVHALIGAFAAFIGRSTGQRDVVVGIPMMNRLDTQAHDVPCTLANVLPLQARIDPWTRVGELVAEAGKTLAGLREHQRYRAEDIRRDCNLLGEGRRLTGPQINIDIYSPTLAFGTLGCDVEVLSAGAADDLSLLVQPLPGQGLRVCGMANPELYDAQALGAHVERFLAFVEAFATDAERPLGQLEAYVPMACPPLAQARQDQATLLDGFARWVASTPDAVALTLGDRSLSYQDLDRQANRLAHLIKAHLPARTSSPQRTIALLLERSLETVVTILAVLKCGAAYVPLDPDAPEERLAGILDECTAELLLCSEATVAKACTLQAEGRTLSIDAQATLEALRQSAEHAPQGGPQPQDRAYVIYTSGSTGKPKGVCVSHHNVVRLFSSTDAWFDYRSSDVWTACHAYMFDASVWEMWGALLHGGRLVIVPVDTTRDPHALLELVVREQVTVFGQIPSAFYRFMEAEADHPELVARMNLRYQCFGGEPLDLGRLAPWFELPRPAGTQLLNLYGITETTINTCHRFITREQVLANAGSLIGRPYADMDILVLDDALQPVPEGAQGEMYVRGEGLAQGYLARPELDATRFVADPFGAPGQRMYRSGDVAIRLADGELEYIGRADQQVKLRGYRIELGEIESCLRAHVSVSNAVALVVSDRANDPRLIAHVVPAPGYAVGDVDSEALREHLREHLPAYMVPSAIGVQQAFAVTANGKLDRRALPAIEANHTRHLEPARDSLDEQVLAHWSTHLDQQRIGIDDDFFAIGGDSIKAIGLCRDLGLPVLQLFEQPTPRGCADYLRHSGMSTGDSWTQAMGASARTDRATLLLVPFAGGNVFAYRQLVEQLGSAFNYLCVRLPGHDVVRADEPFADNATIAAGVVADVLAKVQGPLLVYGHCAGNALALDISRRLEQAGADLRGLTIGGMLLDLQPDEIEQQVAERSGEQIIGFLRELGGFKEVPDAQSLAAIARMTKHDAGQTAAFFSREARQRASLQAPIHVIVGSDDPLTPDYASRYLDWQAYSTDVSLDVIEGGGHYFVSEQPEALAQVLLRRNATLARPQARRTQHVLRDFHNPFDAAHGHFLLLRNGASQPSLWPSFSPIPHGWQVAFGPASRQDCLDHLQAHAQSAVPQLPGLDAPYWPESFERYYRQQGAWTGETLDACIARHARQTPERIAVSDGERSLTYAELDSRCNQLADGFSRLGLRPGDRIVVQLPNVLEFIETTFALFRLGVVPVFALPTDRRNEITHIVQASKAAAYLIKDRALGFDYRDIARELLALPDAIRHVIVLGDAAEFVPYASLYGTDLPVPAGDSRAPALITLSGGSTAMPKLILRRHDDYLYSIRVSAEICQLGPQSVYLCVLPAGHNFTLSSPGFIGTLLAGGRVVMQADPSGSACFASIAREGVTFTALVPSLAQAWLHAPRQHDLSSLRFLQVGGARLSDDVAARLNDSFDFTLQQVYGMSEGLVCYTDLADDLDQLLHTQGRPMSPLDEILVVDDDDQPLAVGQPGHLLVRGPYTIRGYLDAPQQNARAFTADGFYRTGDVVCLRADGYLVVTGRHKDQVNRGGEKIAAEEIEGHLLAHPGVLEAAVIGIPDPHLGERSCAVLVAAPGQGCDTEALKLHLQARGVAVQRIPDQFQWLSGLPKTTLGKIDKKVLRQQFAA
ncbi:MULTISPECIES: non-ribosomal peptide synthetase [unclassified Pseudomonas]|uniref:non-ribosomal peptide synthetase n=1 Tax=unclassified Pseudomonas TaxID=196821 RepID=UPI00244C585E|nr:MULTISPECIES: non-ribosomal peptide synthetase [unclassified Pseudomonas]MDH0304194.1 amino acid adenylation domain-containing protein [Pseudomonas sp. GD04091]MDH1986203.1 amino acid adenylation domain-containing protein [Pseudomonas sp. GD03689]